MTFCLRCAVWFCLTLLTTACGTSAQQQCLAAKTSWHTKAEANVTGALAHLTDPATAKEMKAVGDHEIAVQDLVFIDLCGKRNDADRACLQAFTFNSQDPTCKDAVKAMQHDLGEAIDHAKP